MDKLWLIAAAGFGLAAVGGAALLVPDAVRSRRRPAACGPTLSGPILCGIVLAAMVLGATAPGAPTTTRVIDVAMRAVVAGAFVVAAAYAFHRAQIVAAVAVAVPAALGTVRAGSVWGAVALGAAVAVITIDEDELVLSGIVGLATGQAALRLQWPHRTGGTALIAGVALTALGTSALLNAPPRVRRSITGALVALATIGVAISAVYAFLVLESRHDVTRGVAASRSALVASRRGDTVTAQRDFEIAGAAFARARDRLDGWLAQPARVVPIAAQNQRALAVLTTTGADLAREGQSLIRSADPNATLRHGQVPIAEVRALLHPLDTASTDLDQARARLHGINTTWLVSPLASKVRELERRVDSARDEAITGVQAAQVLPALLGGDGTRRYFVAFQTPAEERANGGIIGNFAVVSFTNGRFDLVRSGRDTDLNEQGSPTRKLIGPADYVKRYGHFQPESTWQNVTMSPDLPSVAQVIEGLYPQSGGMPIDGVVSVDPYAVAALLKLTGPVSVPGLPFELSSKNAAQFLLRDQYTSFGSNGQRVDFLGEAINAVIHRLKTGNLPKIATIAHTLGPVIREGRLKVESTRGAEERFLRRVGAAGAFDHGSGDFVGLVTQNASGNKIDIFQHRELRYAVTLDPARDRTTATATITLRNDAPPSGLPKYVIGGSGPNPTPDGESRVYVSLYSPLALQRARLGGAPFALDTSTELGENVFSGFVTIPSHGTITLRIDLAGRAPVRRAHGGWEYDLFVWHQPTIAPDAVTVTVHGARGVSIDAGRALRADGTGATGAVSLSASRRFAAIAKNR